jgi:hypothetical protein
MIICDRLIIKIATIRYVSLINYLQKNKKITIVKVIGYFICIIYFTKLLLIIYLCALYL